METIKKEDLYKGIIRLYCDTVFPKDPKNPREEKEAVRDDITYLVQEVVSKINLDKDFNLIYINIGLRPYIAKNKYITEKYIRLLLENRPIYQGLLNPSSENYYDVLYNLINNTAVQKDI